VPGPAPEKFKELEDKHTAEITRKLFPLALQIKSGHGGVDLLESWRLIDCLRNGLPLDMDVYDAAAWSCIVPLSQWSVLNRSNSIDVPDFTASAWKSNKRNMDINLDRGGNTKVLVSPSAVDRAERYIQRRQRWKRPSGCALGDRSDCRTSRPCRGNCGERQHAGDDQAGRNRTICEVPRTAGCCQNSTPTETARPTMVLAPSAGPTWVQSGSACRAPAVVTA